MNTFSRDTSLAIVSLFALGGISLSLFALGFVSAAEGGRNPLAEQVRAVYDRFKDVAVAVSEGYAPIPSGIDGGAMGIHYVNATLIGDQTSASNHV